MFLYHFIDPDLRVEIFEIERVTKKGRIDFEMGNWDICTHLHWGLKKISCRFCLFFCLFLRGKKDSFWPFNDEFSHLIETSQLICRANQLTGFCMMGTLVVALLTCTFIPWSLNFFDLSTCNSELRKRYTLRILLMCLEARRGGVLEVVLPGE